MTSNGIFIMSDELISNLANHKIIIITIGDWRMIFMTLPLLRIVIQYDYLDDQPG